VKNKFAKAEARYTKMKRAVDAYVDAIAILDKMMAGSVSAGEAQREIAVQIDIIEEERERGNLS
jgi:phage gp36-like protein